MKTFSNSLLPFLAGISISLLLLAFRSTVTTDELKLSDAITQKKIKFTLQSTGTYNGKSVQLQIINLQSTPMVIKIPAGTLFHPFNEDQQTLVVLEDQLVSIEGNSKKDAILVEAYCSEASDACPSIHSSFRLDETKNGKLKDLQRFIKGRKISKNIYQDLVWIITDGHSVSNLPNESEKDKQVRSFICQLTGQKDTWYSTPQRRTVNEQGIIRSEALDIRGQLKFNCKKDELIHQEVCNDTGEIMMTSAKKAALGEGEVKSIFHMRVQGWKKGNYTLKIQSETECLAIFEFKV